MEQEIERIQYAAPKLERLGTLTELTKVGRSNPGNDFIVYKDGTRGSVNPPRGPRR
ncbi:MAG: lasso RiPP family leader peptide-containing protein [Acidimicrobiia bacterium]